MRIGGFCASMVRICTGEVWVRSTMRSPSSFSCKKKVSCISRAGWPSREIERGEIVVVGLDVRPFGDGEAEIGEDGGDLVDDLADRMDAAGLQRLGAHRQRDVDRLRREAADEVLLLENGAAGGERLADAVLQAVQRRPHDLALLRRHGAEALHQFGDAALLAERGDALGLQRRLVGGLGNARGNVALERDDIGFGCGHFGIRPDPCSGHAFNRKPGRGQAPPSGQSVAG